jgi:hypothetical protein
MHYFYRKVLFSTETNEKKTNRLQPRTMSTATSAYPTNASFADNNNPFAKNDDDDDDHVSNMMPSSMNDDQQTSGNLHNNSMMTEGTGGQTQEQTTTQPTTEQAKAVDTTTEETGPIKEPIVEETAEPTIEYTAEATTTTTTVETATVEIVPEATTVEAAVLTSEPTTESTIELMANEYLLQESFHQDPQLQEDTQTTTGSITSSSTPRKETDDQVLARVLDKFTCASSPLAKEIKQQAEQIDAKIREEEEKKRKEEEERRRKQNELKKQQEQKKKQQSSLEPAKGKRFSWSNFLGFGMVASALGVLGVMVAKRFRWF